MTSTSIVATVLALRVDLAPRAAVTVISAGGSRGGGGGGAGLTFTLV